MKTTTNQLREELEAIATAHDQINSFFWGDLATAIEDTVVVYPIMCAYFPTGTMFKNTDPIDLYIVIADKLLLPDEENLNDIESDTLEVSRDVFNIMNRTTRWGRIGKVESNTFSKFRYTTADVAVGTSNNVKFKLYDTMSVCEIPLTDYDTEGTFQPTCAPVTIMNSDESFTQTVESGSVFVVPDITIDFSVNGVFEQSVTFPGLTNQEINITN